VRPLRYAMHLARSVALLGISAAAFSAAAPTAADLARCAGLAAPAARLACYDALAGGSTDRAAPTAATPPDLTPAPAAQAPPPVVSPPPPTVPSAAPPGAAPVTPAPPPTFASDPRNFGFTEAQRQALAQPHAAPQEPEKIHARVAKLIQNSRTGQSLLVLDNGQAWMFVDAGDDPRLSPGDPVTIKRASLGSFLLLTPSKQSYHVHRTQ
jgi:hypothetical protein